MDYKYWNNKFKTRGLKYFFLDIKAKFVEKSIKNKFAGKALTDEQKELINHYFYYSYLKKNIKNGYNNKIRIYHFIHPIIQRLYGGVGFRAKKMLH